jgi:putative transposase
MRKIKFTVGNYYHIYNRGVDKRVVFNEKNDYLKFIKSLKELNNNSTDAQRDYEKRKIREDTKLSFGYPKLSFLEMPKLVDIICYALLPNHYHLLLKQLVNEGIAVFMHKIGTSYTKNFNHKNKRTGSLFQGTFQAKPITTDEQLLYVSAYINGNAQIHEISRANRWLWSSLQDYMGGRGMININNKCILNDFKNGNDYIRYIKEVMETPQEIKENIKNCLLG